MSSSMAADLSSQDKSFMEKAGEAGHYELEAAAMALSKSKDKQVQDFARMMEKEHKQLSQELGDLAREREFVLPDDPSLGQNAKLLLLKGKEGIQFDVSYAETLGIDAHHEAIELFQEQAEKGDDDEIRGFAQDSLPILKQHLQHAELLKQHLDQATARYDTSKE